MARDSNGVYSVVTLQNLKEGMIIKAYQGFDQKYRQMSDDICAWMKLNFKNTSVVVDRSGEQLDLPVDQLKAGDSLGKIHKFPPSLHDILTVNEKLKKELELRGFNEFYVRQAEKPISAKSSKKKKDIRLANDFIQTVKQSLNLSQEAKKAVKELMNNQNIDKNSIEEVKRNVDEMTDNNSSEAITAIMSLRENDHVYDHCVDVSVIFSSTYFDVIRNRNGTVIFKDEKEAVLAAFLHDIGKAKISKEIIEGTGLYEKDCEERKVLRRHPEFGAEILTKVGMPDYFLNMAHYHHVKLDPSMSSSYPKGVSDADVLFETRLLSIIDAYQALVAGRSYKKSWTPPAVMRYLDTMAGMEFDLDLWNDFLKVMGYYPKGSLVALNDDSLAYVIKAGQEDEILPQVVIVRNAQGEDLEHHSLLDLQEEQDMSIKKDMDSRKIFGDKAFEIFANIDIT